MIEADETNETFICHGQVSVPFNSESFCVIINNHNPSVNWNVVREPLNAVVVGSHEDRL
jgi:hypothetical protein